MKISNDHNEWMQYAPAAIRYHDNDGEEQAKYLNHQTVNTFKADERKG